MLRLNLCVLCTLRHMSTSRYPSQVLCVAEFITFARRTEQAISAGGGPAFDQLYAELKDQLGMLTGIDCGDDHLMDLKIKVSVFFNECYNLNPEFPYGVNRLC